MDMSNFHRKSLTTRRPNLIVLLAQAAARQALTPTAQSVLAPRQVTDDPSFAPEIGPFLAPSPLSGSRAERCTSFNADVAGSLLTRPKGS